MVMHLGRYCHIYHVYARDYIVGTTVESNEGHPKEFFARWYDQIGLCFNQIATSASLVPGRWEAASLPISLT